MQKVIPHYFFMAFLAVIFAAAGVLPSQATATDNKEAAAYTFGVFPFLPPTRLEKVFSPVAAEMSKVLGREVRFQTSSSFKKFSERLFQKEFDFVFIQPFLYIQAADQHGYQSLAARKEILHTVFVVKQDNNTSSDKTIKSIEDLKGKKVALPPTSAAVSLLATEHFKQLGMEKDIKISHQKSHFSCMQKVLIGSADACGTAMAAVRFFEAKMKTKMKVIGKTKGIPHSLYAAHSRIPEKDREAVRALLVSLTETSQAMKRLTKGGAFSTFKSVHDNDYDVVREIKKNIQSN